MNYLHTDNFTVCIKTEDIYLDLAKDVEIGFDTSNYKFEKPLSTGKYRK